MDLRLIALALALGTVHSKSDFDYPAYNDYLKMVEQEAFEAARVQAKTKIEVIRKNSPKELEWMADKYKIFDPTGSLLENFVPLLELQMGPPLPPYMLLLAEAQMAAEEIYPELFDDPQEIPMNKRLIIRYYSCLMDRGPCSKEGAEFKKILPEAIRTQCRNCNDIQKKNAITVLEYINKYEAILMQMFLEKFDYEEKHFKKYWQDLRKKTIMIYHPYVHGSLYNKSKV